MVKHGGGYVIADCRGATINGESMTIPQEVVNAIKQAAEELLPVLYIGPAVTDDMGAFGGTGCAFVSVCQDDGTGCTIEIPQKYMGSVWGGTSACHLTYSTGVIVSHDA